MKVAIIDDNVVFRTLTKIAFENVTSGNSDILLFENGQEAIDYIRKYLDNQEEIPKLILLDLNMPVMDGWNFLDEMLPIQKSFNLNLIIYIVTSSSDEKDFERAESISEVKGYLIKPIGINQIAELIRSITTGDC